MVDIEERIYYHYVRNEQYYILLRAIIQFNPKKVTGDRTYLNHRQALYRERQKMKKVIDNQA